MTGCCVAACRPATATVTPAPTCPVGTEFDRIAAKCVAVSCDANPCANGERCLPNNNVCIRAPCPQFSCQACAGSDEKTCAALSYPVNATLLFCSFVSCYVCVALIIITTIHLQCVYQFDLSTGNAKCDACYVKCASPDLAAYAIANKCTNGAVMTVAPR